MIDNLIDTATSHPFQAALYLGTVGALVALAVDYARLVRQENRGEDERMAALLKFEPRS